jgi:hypothetical protein
MAAGVVGVLFGLWVWTGHGIKGIGRFKQVVILDSKTPVTKEGLVQAPVYGRFLLP